MKKLRMLGDEHALVVPASRLHWMSSVPPASRTRAFIVCEMRRMPSPMVKMRS